MDEPLPFVSKQDVLALCDRIIRKVEGRDDVLTLDQMKDRMVNMFTAAQQNATTDRCGEYQ